MTTHPPDGKVIVFVGPCLAGLRAQRRRRLLRGFEVRPPVARGDVLCALCQRPDGIVILDGYYYTRPSIPHKELLYAIESGVQVYGGASMGALRAAELADLGMRGVGRIFEAYRDGTLDGDDEVAMLHASADDDYRAVTVASVELRHGLERLGRRGHLQAASAEALITALRGVSFDQRTPERLRELAAELLPAAAADRLLAMLRRSSLKRRDAMLTLDAARRARKQPSVAVCQRRSTTLYFDYFRLWGLSVPLDQALAESTLHRALYLALALHPDARELVRQSRARFLLAWLATQLGLEATERAVALRQRQLCRRWPTACALLPELEVEQEARQGALQQLALGHFGDQACALQALGVGGLPDAPGDPVASIDVQRILPPWALVRTLAFTPLLPPALELAQRVFPLARRFNQWSKGAKVGRQQLAAETAKLWGCQADEVEAEGLRRGLLLGDGFAEGLWEILEALLLADRLRPPVSGYAEARGALLACDPSTASAHT